jgi:hypothetical protein
MITRKPIPSRAAGIRHQVGGANAGGRNWWAM